MSATQTLSIESCLQDLCAAIAADPAVQAARDDAETFLADEDALALYREVSITGRGLEQRHRRGEDIPGDEVAAFEELQIKADNHPAISAFNEAQALLQQVASRVNTFVTKTLEKGRVPSEAEIASSGGCGEGCGCHH